MKTTAIFALILSIIVTGCRDKGEEVTIETTTPIEDIEAVHPENVGTDNDVRLNNGTQWQVKRATTEGVERMQEILENSSAQTVEEYRELGEDLYEEQGKLDRHTEQAPATENLKLFLAPLDKKIEKLKEVESVEDGARLKSELEEHLSTYSNFFV